VLATCGGMRSMRRGGGAGSDQRGTARAARRVRTWEVSGSLTHGTWPAAREGGRREARGVWVDPEWAEPR
jgi:hypothetical protein